MTIPINPYSKTGTSNILEGANIAQVPALKPTTQTPEPATTTPAAAVTTETTDPLLRKITNDQFDFNRRTSTLKLGKIMTNVFLNKGPTDSGILYIIIHEESHSITFAPAVNAAQKTAIETNLKNPRQLDGLAMFNDPGIIPWFQKNAKDIKFFDLDGNKQLKVEIVLPTESTGSNPGAAAGKTGS